MISSRKITKIRDLVISLDKEISIIDNNCNQTIVDSNSYLVVTHIGILYNVDGALDCMLLSKYELVNDCYTAALLPNRSSVLLKINHHLLDTNPYQAEALLHPHQSRAFGVAVDGCARLRYQVNGNPGV